MPVTRLTLTDFRNHHASLLDRAGRFNLLVGHNGAGKTNILEALSLLAPGRGLRRAALSDMAASNGAGGFAIHAQLGDAGELGTGTLAGSPERRQVRINGSTASANSLAEWMGVSWLTPAMDRLFTESASGRRRFVDRLVLAIHPGHAHHASRYDAALRERNRLLSGEQAPDPVWLEALEARMAQHGLALHQARQDLIRRLAEALADSAPGPFARPDLTIQSGLANTQDDDALRSHWRQMRGRDRAAGRTLDGPHRDDLIVTMAGRAMPAARCSTGEQKAMLIAIILAHGALVQASSGRPLLLLLDEAAAHLDPLRRAALFERLDALDGQYWLTGTEADLFSDCPAGSVLWQVSDGAVIRG